MIGPPWYNFDEIIPRWAYHGAKKSVFFKLWSFGQEYQKIMPISFEDL